mmetsp:Transcript_18404/g.45179  ORF Transcript_18404/g.45179 Transcript_18404/m.45179 type:complete len:290 (-) Transcript_18404:250-1119(-)|eukprot:CAMPEP_0114523162 /NCGR_PEP_ID=MMETSP0109-20121206/21142_1 /TAXON_ID=29199 /ORGANISM="Chlorarachnion reptans, Strain CCCM449" /LENGTH=289 /DNA_ID=CAMNT_0001704455 /DNA_START=23 /DNA_END=892 /DNA_ORIENTATION=+
MSHRRRQHPDPQADVGDDEHQQHSEYEVESLLAHRKTLTGQLEMLVKWKGYSEEDSTWEPVENVHPELLVDYFQTRLENERKQHQSGSSSSKKPSKDSVRERLIDVNRQLERAEKMCQSLNAQNEELKMTISELVDENEELKTTKQNDNRNKAKADKQNAKLAKEIASLRSNLRQTRQRLHRQVDLNRKTFNQDKKKEDNLICKIEHWMSSMTKRRPTSKSHEQKSTEIKTFSAGSRHSMIVSSASDGAAKKRKRDPIRDQPTIELDGSRDIFAKRRPLGDIHDDPAFL